MTISRAELQAQLEESDRKFGRQSLYYFSKFCLGYSLLQDNPHKEVCAWAQNIITSYKTGLDLEPRGCFKTTIFTQSLPVWLLVRNPNIRILLDSTVLQNSIDNLGVVKRHFENPKFKFLFGDMEGMHWTAEEITVKTRTEDRLKEPSIRCASPERTQVGPHYDVIIADDLVSAENSKTNEGRKLIKDHFKLLFSLLEPGGCVIVVGTRWHYEDLYQMIQDEFVEFSCRIKSATDENTGKLYFGERLTREFLDQQKARLGRDFYSAQYENDPAPEDKDSKFQEAWFKRYDILPDAKENQRYGFITIDPGGERKGSDDWVILSAYCDDRNNLWFDRALKDHWSVSKAWDVLFGLVDVVNPIAIGLETTGGQKYLFESLQDEMRRRNKFLNIVPLTHAGDSKEYRILRLAPRYQNGSIYHSKQMQALEEQLRRFPKGKDDIADAAAMILEIAISPRSKLKSKNEIKSVDELIKRVLRNPQSNRPISAILGKEG